MIPINMGEQINLRLPQKLLETAKSYSEEYGFSNVQDFIKETIREKLFEEGEFSKEEIQLAKEFKSQVDKKSLYGTKEDLLNTLSK